MKRRTADARWSASFSMVHIDGDGQRTLPADLSDLALAALLEHETGRVRFRPRFEGRQVNPSVSLEDGPEAVVAFRALLRQAIEEDWDLGEDNRPVPPGTATVTGLPTARMVSPATVDQESKRQAATLGGADGELRFASGYFRSGSADGVVPGTSQALAGDTSIDERDHHEVVVQDRKRRISAGRQCLKSEAMTGLACWPGASLPLLLGSASMMYRRGGAARKVDRSPMPAAPPPAGVPARDSQIGSPPALEGRQ